MSRNKESLFSPELLEKARVELNEIQSEVPGQIQALRERILGNPNWNFRTDDAFLLRFLRARKFDQDRTVELIANYYKQRDLNPQFFKKSTSDLETALSSNYQGVLLQTDTSGRRVLFYSSINHWNPDEYSLEELLANSALSLECLIEHEDVQINGISVIVDSKGLGLKHFLSIGPRIMKRVVESLVNSFPIRYKAIHYVNQPLIFDAVFLILKPFLSKKFISRINFHGSSLGTLHEHFSREILPENLGGFVERYDNSAWNKTLKEHDAVLTENMKFGFVRTPEGRK